MGGYAPENKLARPPSAISRREHHGRVQQPHHHQHGGWLPGGAGGGDGPRGARSQRDVRLLACGTKGRLGSVRGEGEGRLHPHEKSSAETTLSAVKVC